MHVKHVRFTVDYQLNSPINHILQIISHVMPFSANYVLTTVINYKTYRH